MIVLETVGDTLLCWIPDPNIELVFVMVFVPVIMNMIAVIPCVNNI